MSRPLDIGRLWELLSYNPETGEFRWRVDRGRHRAGLIAGCHHNGYIRIGIEGINYFAHRVAWAHHYGVWPSREIDHINGKPSDNRISNLRPATHHENLRNSQRRSDNRSGIKGVYMKNGKWKACIRVNGTQIWLGTYLTANEAASAYQAAAQQHFGSFARFE